MLLSLNASMCIVEGRIERMSVGALYIFASWFRRQGVRYNEETNIAPMQDTVKQGSKRRRAWDSRRTKQPDGKYLKAQELNSSVSQDEKSTKSLKREQLKVHDQKIVI